MFYNLSPKLETMASSRNTSHVRSFSWPSASSHPSDLCIEHFVLKLRNSDAGVPSSFSASSICHNLVDIKDLYQAINNSIECPLNQQLLSFEHHHGVEEALEGSLVLLDAFASAMDIISLMESILELESSLRRKNCVEEKHIGAYMLSRKKTQKMANTFLKNLHNVMVGLEKNENDLVPVIRMSREAQIISFSTLTSAVAYLTLAKAKGTSRSVLTKLMHSKCVSCEKQGETSEIEKVDQALLSFEAKKPFMNAETVHNWLKQLEALEMAVKEIEECLESVSRCLLQTRVSLLNVLSH